MATSPKAWATRFPVYQIDFSATASGKRVAATKRRVRWRFGFPNTKALEEGLTGTDCRGEEHDVTITWSITSGKRQVSMDGREIHYSSSRSSVLDFSWSTKGNHVLKVICHAAPPLSATPGFRQYDLLIDGQSFFTMPKVYELGIKGPIPSHARVPGYSYSNPTSPSSMGSGSQGRSIDYGRSTYVPHPASRDQEEEDLRTAIQASIEESRRHLGPKAGDDNRSAQSTPQITSGAADLLDLGGPTPGPVPVQQLASDTRSVGSMPSYYSAPPAYHQAPPAYGSPAPYQSPPPIQQANPVASPAQPGALVPVHGPPGTYYGAPPPTTPSYATQPPSYATQPPSYASPPPSYASPPPVPPPNPQYAQYASAPASNLLNRPQGGDVFGLGSPPEVDPFAPRAPPPPTHQDLASVILGAYTSPTNSSAPQTPGAYPPNGFAPSPGAPQYPPGANGHSPQPNDGAPTMSMNALALTREEAPQNEFESVMRKLVNIDRIDEPAEGVVALTMLKKEEAKKAPKGKSRPLPPSAVGMVGVHATLGQMKQVNPQGTLKYDAEGKIMKAPPAGLFQHGAMGQGALVVHGQGAPPLQQAQGFGVGARMPNGGFSQQQPQHPYGYHQQQQQQPQYR